MAFTTYAELQTAVATWLKRGDQTALIPDYIALFEAEFNRTQRLSKMEVRAVSTLDLSVEDPQYFQLPTDFLEMRNFQINIGEEIQRLEYIAPELADQFYGGKTDRPKYFSIIADQLQFVPVPDQEYEVEMTYYAKLAPLANESNWIFENYPDVYLFGALIQAARANKNDGDVARWQGLYDRVMQQVMAADDKYTQSGSTLRMWAA